MNLRNPPNNFNEAIQGINSLLILLCGFAFLEWGTNNETIKQGVKDLMFIVATFYFGGSRSSAKKDETIAQMSQQPQVMQTGDQPQVNVNQDDPQTNQLK